MNADVGAAWLAKNLARAVGEHLVGVHVVRGACARLIDVDNELIAQRAAQDLVGSLDDRGRDLWLQAPQRRVGFRCRLLDEDGRRHEIGGRAQSADGEVFDGTLRLDAVVRVIGNRELTERIALGPKALCHQVVTNPEPRGPSPRPVYCPRMLLSFFDSVLQLIVKTSTDLPPDVRAAMKTSLVSEPAQTRASQALTIIAQNIDLAADGEGAICQDTGMPTFEVKVPLGTNQIWMRGQIREAVAEATRRGKLRPNSVDSITGKNSGDNLGPGTPIIHFDQWDRDEVEIKLILKGGGCENTNAQYALPVELPHLGRADRTLDGVRKCILHAVWQAQGKGCAPGAVGVCVGGDRTSGYTHAKEQLFRTLDDVNEDPRLAEVEAAIMSTVNNLEIGTMGFGGKVTLIGCKIGALNRLPASFFVSVAYDCWAFRRLGVELDASSGAIDRWLYRDPSHPIIPMLDQAGFTRTGREITLDAPMSDEAVR